MKTLLVALSCFISVGIHPFGTNVFSQSITNTLGTNGVFTIKDASTNYLTLSQSNGQVNILKTLRLENTTGFGVGILFKGADRFLHNFGTNNSFLGINSGNFTMTGTYNTAVGNQTLAQNTTGDSNTVLGFQSLLFNATGTNNTALGLQVLYYNSSGSSNIALGNQALFINTAGNQNTALGIQSLTQNYRQF